MLFLPQFVVVIAFPSMSKQGAGRQMHLVSLGAVLVIGAVTTLGVAVLSPLAVVFVGGSQYSDLEGLLWVFAALGTLLAMLQLMIYNIVARQRQRTVLLVWVALVVLVAAAYAVDSLTSLLTVVVCIDAALFVVLLVRSLMPSYNGDQPPAAGRRLAPGLSRAGPRQWAAACQLAPMPTDTSSGTVSSAAAAICSRTSASSGSRSPVATSKHELVVHLQQHP